MSAGGKAPIDYHQLELAEEGKPRGESPDELPLALATMNYHLLLLAEKGKPS